MAWEIIQDPSNSDGGIDNDGGSCDSCDSCGPCGSAPQKPAPQPSNRPRLNIHRAVTLIYLKDPASFQPERYSFGDWELQHYYPMFRMPISELFGHTPAERADSLIDFTVTGFWRSQRRRSIREGDIMVLGVSPWVYLDQQRANVFGSEAIPLVTWPSFAIAPLPNEQVQAAFLGKIV